MNVPCISGCVSDSSSDGTQRPQSVDDLLPEGSVVLDTPRGWRAVLTQRAPLPHGSLLYFSVWSRATIICPDVDGTYDALPIGGAVSMKYFPVTKEGKEFSPFQEHYGKLISAEKHSY